jgi:hypothetical protein
MSYDYEAEHFTAQCRRDALRFPIRDIGEVAPRRIVSKDFAAGVADIEWADFSSGLPYLEQL